MRALLKFTVAGMIVLSLAAGVVYWAQSWRLWKIEADQMAAWRPSAAHTETRREGRLPLIPVAAQSEQASLDRSLEFAIPSDAILAEEEANTAARAAGWVASGLNGSYGKEISSDVHASLHIARVGSRLWVTLTG